MAQGIVQLGFEVDLVGMSACAYIAVGAAAFVVASAELEASRRSFAVRKAQAHIRLEIFEICCVEFGKPSDRHTGGRCEVHDPVIPFEVDGRNEIVKSIPPFFATCEDVGVVMDGRDGIEYQPPPSKRDCPHGGLLRAAADGKNQQEINEPPPTPFRERTSF